MKDAKIASRSPASRFAANRRRRKQKQLVTSLLLGLIAALLAGTFIYFVQERLAAH
jgi:hypothetical protein